MEKIIAMRAWSLILIYEQEVDKITIRREKCFDSSLALLELGRGTHIKGDL